MTEQNHRVTLAVLDNNIRYLTTEIQELRAEIREQLHDHELRLRALEGSNRQGIMRDVAAFLAAIGAGIFGWLTKNP